jgi:quinol monooxygenase YgiN
LEEGDPLLARSLLFMQAREGCREDLIRTFVRLEIPQRALRHGCLSVELQVPPDESAPVLVTALWADRAGYDRWLESPSRQETSAELFPLLTEEPEGVVYDVRVAAGNPAAPEVRPA